MGRFLSSRLSKAVPGESGTSTGMTAVQSLSFAQRKSEQNKIAIAKAGYHHGDGILPFVLIRFISRSQHPLQYSLRENSP